MKTKLLLLITFLRFGIIFAQNEVQVQVQNVLCFGENSGFITVLSSNGTAPYVYSINNSTSYQANNVFSGLTSGNYIISVQDSNNVIYSTSVTVFEPSPISIASANLDQNTLNVAANGGVGPYLYSLTNTAGIVLVPFQSFPVFSNLSQGTYLITVQDATGCLSSTNVILNPNLPTISVSSTTVQEGGNAVFPITLSNFSTQNTVVTCSITSTTANQSDYSFVTTTVTIPAGQTSAFVSVPTLLDTFTEGNETFTICGTVTSGNTANTTSCGTCTILDSGTISAFADYFDISVNQTGLLGSVIANDLLNGVPVPASNFVVTPVSQGPLSIDANGILTVSQNVTLGSTYIIVYQVCEANASPLNCASAQVSVYIQPTASLSLAAIGTYNDFNNDGFTNVGDVINYQYTVTNTGQEVLNNVQVLFGASPVSNGEVVSGSPLTSLAVGAIDSTTFTYTYVITQDDISASNAFGSSFVSAQFNGQTFNNYTFFETPLNISNGIKLNLFFDNNGDGVQNGSEQNYNGGDFTYQINGGSTTTSISNSGMLILYEGNPTNVYNLSCMLGALNNLCNNQYSLATSFYNNITVAAGSGITTYNFPITTAPCDDVSVNLYSNWFAPRPGFVYTDTLLLKNNGNQTIASGIVTFTKDSVVSITSTSPTTTATATGFTYSFINLLPNEQRTILVNMQVPTIPTVSLNQILTNVAIVSLPPNDVNPANNSSTLSQIIIGSYDPNDKQESHGGKILHSTFTANDYLTYTIRFENTGTAEAINIRVNDVLDVKLNPNTIRMVAASNPYVLDRVGNMLNWKFDGVNLPPSSPASAIIGHGFITFQIKPNVGYAVGDIIPNIASIYFDFNPAIVTEPCITEFVSTLATNEFDANSVSVFPNPVQNKLTITNISSIDSIEVISILGQTVLLQTTNSPSVDLSSLEKGVYFVKVTTDGKSKTSKIIKE